MIRSSSEVEVIRYPWEEECIRGAWEVKGISSSQEMDIYGTQPLFSYIIYI